MAYKSFSLKYRPQRFEEIVGQEHVSRTLTNAIRTDRIVHAYLFTGPRGTGKTSTARVLAKALNCASGPTPEPCGTCEFCKAVEDGRAMDVIEIDAASNRGIDEIRELREKVKYSPAEARSKVYILDEVHMLTTEAFNALLKTLEEPPAHSYFVLATTEPHKVPATILSRCQRFDFRQIPGPRITEMLERIAEQEGIQAEADALAAVARAAEGGMRDAESIFDQVVAYTDGAVTLEIVNSVLGVTEAETLGAIADLMVTGDVPGSFGLVDRLISGGKDVAQLLADLTLYLRDLLRVSLGSEPSAWRLPGDGGEARMRRQAEALGAVRLMAAIHTLAEAQTELRSSTQHALLLELTLVSLCQPPAAAPSRAAPAPSAAPEQTVERASATRARPTVEPPAPPVIEGPLTLHAIAANWAAVPGELKRMGRLPVGAVIREACPTALEGELLTLTFPPTCGFHYDQVSTRYCEVVQEAISRVFGAPLRVNCRLAQSEDELKPDLHLPTPEPAVAEPEPAPRAAQESPAAELAPPAEAGAQPRAPEIVTQSPVDTVCEQTLSLFEGSQELRDDE